MSKVENKLKFKFRDDEIKKLYDHIFFFKKAREILAVEPTTLKTFSLPTEKVLFQWVYDTFKCIVAEDENGFEVKTPFDYFKKWFESEYVKLIQINQFDIFEYGRDPFLNKPQILKRDNKLNYVAPRLYIPPYEFKFKVEQSVKDEILQDYLTHFTHFDEILKWIISCRFNESRRGSFLYLRINAGFGKTFFLSMLEELGLAVSVKHSQLKDQSASDISPSLFRNSLVLAVDEFTHFGQEMKEMTHGINLSPKYQLREYVPLYAKIFLSAEKSTSFFGDAGVDPQIADRNSIIDLGHAGKLDDREIFKRSKKLYKEVLKEWIYNVIVAEVERYVNLGEIEANKEADDFMVAFHEKYSPRANTIENISTVCKDELYQFIDWSETSLQDRPKNSYYEKISQICFVKNKDEIICTNPTKLYEIIIREQGDQFAKVAKFKQTSLDEIFNTSMDKRPLRIGARTVRAVLVNLSKIEGKRDIAVDFCNGENKYVIDRATLGADGKLYDKDGKELF